jgi:hypothetical protein
MDRANTRASSEADADTPPVWPYASIDAKARAISFSKKKARPRNPASLDVGEIGEDPLVLIQNKDPVSCIAIVEFDMIFDVLHRLRFPLAQPPNFPSQTRDFVSIHERHRPVPHRHKALRPLTTALYGCGQGRVFEQEEGDGVGLVV